MDSRIRVISVNNALSPQGLRRIAVVLGFECPPPLSIKESGKKVATSITISPGSNTPIPQTPMENKLIVYFTEDEWRMMENKPNVDDEYLLNIDKSGEMSLRRA